ncbi:hypothetical protein D3C72_2098580 [compost metagenome]
MIPVRPMILKVISIAVEHMILAKRIEQPFSQRQFGVRHRNRGHEDQVLTFASRMSGLAITQRTEPSLHGSPGIRPHHLGT